MFLTDSSFIDFNHWCHVQLVISTGNLRVEIFNLYLYPSQPVTRRKGTGLDGYGLRVDGFPRVQKPRRVQQRVDTLYLYCTACTTGINCAPPLAVPTAIPATIAAMVVFVVIIVDVAVLVTIVVRVGVRILGVGDVVVGACESRVACREVITLSQFLDDGE